MLRQAQTEIRIQSVGRQFTDLTETVASFVRQSGITTGMVVLHLRHTSASLLIQKNADPTVQMDLESFMGKLAVDSNRIYAHRGEGADDMPAHIRSVLCGVNLSIPVAGAALRLGQWQAIYLWEHRMIAHEREVVVHLVGE